MSCNPCTRIFVGSDGRPLKFRIQPNLDLRVREALERIIKKYGGTVISNVPVRGLVVVDPESMIGKALIGTWSWTERPERHFVSIAFVNKCVDAKALLPTEDVRIPRMPLASKMARKVPFGRDSNDYVRPSLSDDKKVKMAHYLAEIRPENRTSNQTFRNLVDRGASFPWVDNLPWQAFRNDYCKNKPFYDKKIREIAKRKERALSKDRFIDFKNPEPEVRSTHKGKETNRKSALSEGSFKHLDLRNVPGTTSRSDAKASSSRSIRKNIVTKSMDADDMRSSFLLGSTVENDEEDESDVVSLLDLFAAGNHRGVLGPSSSLLPNDTSPSPHYNEDEDTFSEALAKEARLTVDEVKQKLAGFSGDRARAKDFLIRCRRLMEDLFIQSFEEPSSISQA